MLRFSDLQPRAEVDTFFAGQGLTLRRYLAQIDVWVVEAPTGRSINLAAQLAGDARIAWVEADGWLHADADPQPTAGDRRYAAEIVPNDPYYQAQQANLRLIGMPQAWQYSTGVKTWPIAVIDSGIDLDHPDLADKLWINQAETPGNGVDDDQNGYIDDVRGWNFVAGNADPQDDHSHGSHVAGVAAAEADNGIGIAGIAWRTPVMAVKVLNSSGAGAASDVAEGILYAADNGARILNLSLGDDKPYQTITEAVIYARNQGCLVMAAAGNTTSAVEYPAAQAEALAIAATTNSDLPASFSNRGPEVDLAAPGVNIFSANNSGGYYLSNGTSAATPQVSGLAALVWNLQPDWTASQVTFVITSTAQDVWSSGKDNLTGWGRIAAAQAVETALRHLYLPVIQRVEPGCPYDDYCAFLPIALK